MQGNKKMQDFFSSLNPNKATQEEIKNFMQGLLKNYVLEVAGEKFAFAEIEIYTSADKNTYKRVSSAGDIFFHNFGAEPIAGPRRCANAILNIRKPNLSFCLLDAKKPQEAAKNFSCRVRRADFDASGNPIEDFRRLTSMEFEIWLAKSGKKEAEKYKKTINKYNGGAENENSTLNQAD